MDLQKDFNFEFEMPFEKAEREDGGWYIRGIAAGPDVDAENERLAPQALQGFVSQITSNPIPFLNWHRKDDVTAEIGTVDKAWLEPDFKMGVEVKLDEDHPGAQYIWKKLEKGKQYGMSVSGKVANYKDEYEKSVGRSVRTYYNVALNEISLTTKPIYTPSFGTVLRKAADAAGGDNSMEVETPIVVEETATQEGVEKSETTTASSEQQVTEPVTTTVEDQPDVDKAHSARTVEDARKLKKLVGMHREMSALIAELVLSAEPDAETPNTDSTPTEVTTAKAEETQVTPEDLQKANSEIAELREELNRLREQTPAGQAPGLLIGKSDIEELGDMLKSMDTRSKLLFALRASHGENK